jgi:hypothetical protein
MVSVAPINSASSGIVSLEMRSECERICLDPKDCDLCLGRVKPGETLVEAHRNSDVQIDRQIWV